ncbi:hypothetical protein Pcinc_001184 [Petrolisthes cinctipes]|uniref:Uncharacterized protein n=1 Tax=Petrolisthes cinctipes TaxID=88211 RepID=A0AAE1L3D6_PETCI|nr:hypothetical protein Pcinc_001184 [Petrolisthes cinctipes]
MPEEAAAMWKRIGKHAKFYCKVRSCDQVADEFVNAIGPLRDQVIDNSARINELERKFGNQQRKLSDQEVSFRVNIEQEVEKAVDHAAKDITNAQEKIKSDMREEVK